MGVSVIIPCYNEEKYIQECLYSLIENGYSHKNMEILVVDGRSSDKTRAIVQNLINEYPIIQLIDNPKQKTPFALNLGIKSTQYELLLIAGAHSVYPKGYITGLVDAIKKPGVHVVGGAIETQVKHSNAKTEAIKFVLSHKFGVGNSMFRIGADKLTEVDTVPFGLYKKEVFEKAGLYNEKLIRNHDMELSKRIQLHGFRIWLQPTLKCTYYARETFKGLAKNNYGNGFWNVKTLFITKRFKSLSLRHYIPLLFLLSLLLPLIPGLLFHPVFLYLSVCSLLAYMLLIVSISLKNANKNNFGYLVLVFIVLHFSYGWGSLMGIFSMNKK